MYSDFERILKDRGLKKSEVARGANVPYSAITDWKAGRYTPKHDKMERLASFLGVPVELLSGSGVSPSGAPAADDASPHLSPDEEELLRGYRVASGPVRKIMLGAARDALKGEGGARLSDSFGDVGA